MLKPFLQEKNILVKEELDFLLLRICENLQQISVYKDRCYIFRFRRSAYGGRGRESRYFGS